MKRIVFVSMVLFAIPTLYAEGIQIAPFYGLRTGSEFDNELTGRDVDLDSSGSYGGAIDIPFIHHGQYLELLYSNQETELNGGGLLSGIDISIEQWQAGLLQEYDYDKMKPFLVGLLGVTHFDVANGHGSTDLFSMGLGGGVKYYPTTHIGLRLDLRGYVSFFDGSGGVACNGGCVASYSGDVFWQMEVAPSVFVAF